MLINCVAYQGGKKLADVTVEAISDYLAKPECFVWIALKDPDAGEMAAMKEEFGLHALAIEDVMNGNQRPKIEEYGDTLFCVLHTLELDDDGEVITGQVNIFAGPNFVLSVRHRAQQGFTDVRARCEREPELLREGSGFVLYALMDSVVDRYAPVLETLSSEIEELEDRIFEKHDLAGSRAIIEDLYSLKRRLVIIAHHVTPLVDPVGKLIGGRIPQICVGMQAYYRDVYDHLQRVSNMIDARREMIVTAIQVNLGMISLAENEVTKRLGSFAALFAVPTMIAGIYGMNFEHIPELHFRFGYQICLAAMLVLDLFLFFLFRRINWL
ncbi:magnesium/cobalt transporter CorA [Paraburkholderia silvatlantica]|uniref:Magnesium transport protein CorA n=1 Tax=Paraburkholderia silvatlantica TaxID=321895 RepID=A0A2U1AHU6_9BURK|nr:magnesium/cobalt transporter CorA [Paraburkholderia silvatlantica]MBB2929331.1 magnesium transporter [Paraburkholderia silvatlantica]PVY35977.1 magnesium transporter [Paraburkholderia silvatlantica]PXW39925.1 magnesium transporter [Paraburkholderia silvatlantica]PYE19727.1 magnesium transporter [Paraburkholderia silvatlantica]TDQ99549.1 magnesium transporter [Paraburkholderia silvatlantica]